MVPSSDLGRRYQGRLVDQNSGTPIKYANLYCMASLIDTVYSLIVCPQTATALGKLGHPDGELNLTRAAAKHGVIQMVQYSFPTVANNLL